MHGGDTKRKMFMYTIDLAYVGRGLHEELVAYIADQRGYYADEGVHVALRDGCSWNEERLRHAQVSQRLFSTSPGEETL